MNKRLDDDQVRQIVLKITSILENNEVPLMDSIKILSLMTSGMVNRLKNQGVPIDIKIELFDTSNKENRLYD